MTPSFVLCFALQRLVFGAVVEETGGGLTVLEAQGELRIRTNQVLYRWPDPAAAPPGGQVALTALVADKETWLRNEADRIPLAGLAERLPKGKPLLLETIAHALGPPTTADAPPWRTAALCWALVHDRLRFRREQGGFVAVDLAERAARELREAQAQAEKELAKVAVPWAEGLKEGRWIGAGHPLAGLFLQGVWSLAAHEKHSPQWATLGRTLNLHEHGAVSVTERLKPWLVAAKAWPGWPDLWLERASVHQAFPPEALAEALRLAEELADTPSSQNRRRDLRQAVAYTIDAASTFDYDDAYSLEANGETLVARVHIAEPAAALVPGHPVFDEAERRMSSVYTENGIFPMLPPALSLGRFSLMRGRTRECLSFAFKVTDAGLEWLGAERSLIEVRANLDYAQTERLIVSEAESWGRLAQACEAQAQDRARRGAQLADRKDVRLDVATPAKVRLAIVPRGGPSTRIIEELAIAYNLAAGLYCQRHGLPALYRVQTRPRLLGGSGPISPAGGALGKGSLRGGSVPMSHARFSVEGAPHEGIACERYTQTTSPNRRFADLVVQRQIAAHASGQAAPFSAEQMAGWGDRAEARATAYDEAERAIQDHWVRVFLTQNPQFEAWGTVRKTDTHGARVWLDELAVAAEAEASSRLTAGKRQRFRVSAADIDQRRVWVTPT
jgi:exoribonuclease II